MKIVYCMWGIFVTGGKERVLINKANYLVKHGYEVCIVTTEQQRRKPAYPMDRKIQHYDLEINYSLKPHSSYVAKIWNYVTKTYKHQKKMGQLLKTLNADIVISTFGTETYILPKMKDESKKIVELHNSKRGLLYSNRTGLLGVFDKWLGSRMVRAIKRYDNCVVLTKETMAD